MLSVETHRGNREAIREGSYGRFLYNFYRTYDPATGRYLEADPIGQVGGINVYEYAFSDPLNLIDPRGSSAVGVTATDIRRAFRHFAPFERGEQAARRAREEGASPGVQDALQHCVASCETAKRDGWAFSTALGGLYEEFGILVPPPTTYGDLVMDLHNNAVGNRLADKTCDCEEACRRAASNGELITGWKGKGPTIPSVPPHVF